jgi:hypothetical protein
MTLYRCTECTLLRVEREGETCAECKANAPPQTAGNPLYPWDLPLDFPLDFTPGTATGSD